MRQDTQVATVASYLAIAQMPMSWSVEENCRTIEEYIRDAAGAKAQIVLFPELTITGFHRAIRQTATREAIEISIARIRSACATHGIAAIVGTPVFAADGIVHNSVIAIDDAGAVVTTAHKVGLTESEARFFSPGRTRDTFQLHGIECSVILCREILDEPLPAEGVGATPRIIFWPGYISWNEGESSLSDYRTRASAMALLRQAFIVQSNWPGSLNDPRERLMGGSLAIAPTGAIIHQCPLDSPALVLIPIAME